MSLDQQVKQLSDKASKYDKLKKRYAEYGRKLTEGAELLEEQAQAMRELAEDIDPYLSVQKKEGKGKSFDYSEVFADAVNKLHNGTELTTDKLERLFPSLTDNQRHYLFNNKLREAAGVGERKDGRRVVLYSKRN